MSHARQPRPDSGLGFQANFLESSQVVPSSLGSGGDAGVLAPTCHCVCWPVIRPAMAIRVREQASVAGIAPSRVR